MTTINLLTKLEHKQGKLSDYKFAKLIKINRSLWQLTRTRKKAIGITLLKAIVQHFPDLDLDVIMFLRNGEEHGNENTKK